MVNPQFLSSGRLPYLIRALQRSPAAIAHVSGSTDYPAVNGDLSFYRTDFGVLIAVQIFGLPRPGIACQDPVFALHIHSGSSCTGNEEYPFADALTHYNPDHCPHPHHAGDLLPLWGNDGYAFTLFLSDRFSVEEIIGRTVIVHRKPDDFTTQPAGNAGEKIACGKIRQAAPCCSSRRY